MEKSTWVVFSAADPALHRPRPTPTWEASRYRVRASVADGRDPPVSSRFPQSPPLLRQIPTTGAIPAKVASCHPIPSSRCRSMIAGRTMTSHPLRHHRSAAPLCHRCMVEMPPPGARRQGLMQPTLLTELALPKGCHLGPSVELPTCVRGRLGVVRWCAFSRRVDTAPPTLSSVARTTAYGQNPLPLFASLRTYALALSATLSSSVSPGARPYKRDPLEAIWLRTTTAPSSTPVSCFASVFRHVVDAESPHPPFALACRSHSSLPPR
jgi:hypothetical protein